MTKSSGPNDLVYTWDEDGRPWPKADSEGRQMEDFAGWIIESPLHLSLTRCPK